MTRGLFYCDRCGQPGSTSGYCTRAECAGEGQQPGRMRLKSLRPIPERRMRREQRHPVLTVDDNIGG